MLGYFTQFSSVIVGSDRFSLTFSIAQGQDVESAIAFNIKPIKLIPQ